jgi:tetratricopeptide (TPR) repeat protein
LEAGSLSDCRILVDKALLVHPQAQEWKSIAADLGAAQGVAALVQADKALTNGDATAASSAISVAAMYLSDDQRVTDLRRRLESITTGNKERSRLLVEAETLIRDGDGRQAEALLAPLAATNATDEEVTILLRRARKLSEEQNARVKAVGERIQQGEEALARKDYDAALLHFTAAQQLDPKNVKATAGLDEVTKAQASLTALRERFQLALKERDLAGAEASLKEMRRIAPASSTLVLAENEFTNSRLVEENKAKAQADHQATIAAAALALQKRMTDQQQTIPALQQALTAFVKEHGEAPAVQAGLPVLLEDRHQRERIDELLKQLDKAILSHDSKHIATVITDADYSKALNELSTMAGLVFESSIQSFSRKENLATTTVAIRHALKTFPERTLTMVYTMNRQGEAWIITGAALQ